MTSWAFIAELQNDGCPRHAFFSVMNAGRFLSRNVFKLSAVTWKPPTPNYRWFAYLPPKSVNPVGGPSAAERVVIAEFDKMMAKQDCDLPKAVQLFESLQKGPKVGRHLYRRLMELADLNSCGRVSE